MSNTELTINNIKYTYSNYSIIVGELSILTKPHVSITVPPEAEQVKSHVILQKNNDIKFKNLMAHCQCPVNPFSISVYDQRGFLCNTWESSRANNSSGNVRITTEDMELLSNIVIPTVPDGEQIYLVISSYPAFDSCNSKRAKKIIIKEDIELLKQKVDTTKIILFIAQNIYYDFCELGEDVSSLFSTHRIYNESSDLYEYSYTEFKNIIVADDNKFIDLFCEYIAGKNVCGSKPSFQGMLNFGPNTDVSVGIFSHVDDEHFIECQVRRNGRIQINTSNLKSSVRFFVLLNHVPLIGSFQGQVSDSLVDTYENLRITEETTGLSFPIVSYTPDKLVGLNETHLQSIITSFQYYNYLNNEKSFDNITNNPENTMLYMFKNPLKFAELIDTDDKYSKMLVEYSSSLHKQIIDFFNTNIMQANSEVFPCNISLTRSYAVHTTHKPTLMRQSSIPYS